MGVIQKILATAKFDNNKSEFLEIELNQGKEITDRVTKPYGCSVKYKS